MNLNELKLLVVECLNEISGDTSNDIENVASVKISKKKIEVAKQALEREKQKQLGIQLKAAQLERRNATDPETRKNVDLRIKELVNRRKASVAAINASRQTANSIR